MFTPDEDGELLADHQARVSKLCDQYTEKLILSPSVPAEGMDAMIDLVDLTMQMLNPDPTKRLTIDQVVAHKGLPRRPVGTPNRPPPKVAAARITPARRPPAVVGQGAGGGGSGAMPKPPILDLPAAFKQKSVDAKHGVAVATADGVDQSTPMAVDQESGEEPVAKPRRSPPIEERLLRLGGVGRASGIDPVAKSVRSPVEEQLNSSEMSLRKNFI